MTAGVLSLAFLFAAWFAYHAGRSDAEKEARLALREKDRTIRLLAESNAHLAQTDEQWAAAIVAEHHRALRASNVVPIRRIGE